MSLRRHVLQVVALVTAVALVFGAFAGSASAKKMTKGQKAKVRAELRKQVKKNPGAVKRKSFLRRAALVNFKLPVTIRLRNACDERPEPGPTVGGNPSAARSRRRTACTQGTALNQRTVPTAKVNLGPSLGSRDVAIGGALAAVVEFQDTYDGGALGNVNIKILPGNKTLTTSSVPLLWNDGHHRRRHAFGHELRQVGHASRWRRSPRCSRSLTRRRRAATTGPTGDGQHAAASSRRARCYNSLFYDVPGELRASAPVAGLPGYTVYTAGGSPNGVFLPVKAAPSVNNPDNIQAGGVVGNNDWIGTNPNPFPTGSAPTPRYGDRLVQRAEHGAPHQRSVPGHRPGRRVGQHEHGYRRRLRVVSRPLRARRTSRSATPVARRTCSGTSRARTSALTSRSTCRRRSTRSCGSWTRTCSSSPSLIEGEDYPAGIFNCRQIVTGAVQNYIPGVRLTGSLRIAPAITKDGKVRIAKATVQSDVNNPDRVALSACLFPAKPYNAYTAGLQRHARRRRFRRWRRSSPAARVRTSAAPARRALR